MAQMEFLQDPGLQHSKWNFYKILDYNTPNGISTRSWITTLQMEFLHNPKIAYKCISVSTVFCCPTQKLHQIFFLNPTEICFSNIVKHVLRGHLWDKENVALYDR